MSPITHLLLSWTLAERSSLGDRDKKLVSWAGVLPDIDGVGLVVDISSAAIGWTPTTLYQDYHHVVLHGLPGAILIAGVVGMPAKAKGKVIWLACLLVHVHLMCDLIGSRGPAPEDVWPLSYLGPISSRLTFAWDGQWALNAWPNLVITISLLVGVFVSAAHRGRSPVSLFSEQADRVFVRAIRSRWASWGTSS